jgi:hypothetical protein
LDTSILLIFVLHIRVAFSSIASNRRTPLVERVAGLDELAAERDPDRLPTTSPPRVV